MKIPYINWFSFDKDNQNYETFGNIAKIEELASYTETDDDVAFFVV